MFEKNNATEYNYFSQAPASCRPYTSGSVIFLILLFSYEEAIIAGRGWWEPVQEAGLKLNKFSSSAIWFFIGLYDKLIKQLLNLGVCCLSECWRKTCEINRWVWLWLLFLGLSSYLSLDMLHFLVKNSHSALGQLLHVLKVNDLKWVLLL